MHATPIWVHCYETNWNFEFSFSRILKKLAGLCQQCWHLLRSREIDIQIQIFEIILCLLILTELPRAGGRINPHSQSSAKKKKKLFISPCYDVRMRV